LYATHVGKIGKAIFVGRRPNPDLAFSDTWRGREDMIEAYGDVFMAVRTIAHPPRVSVGRGERFGRVIKTGALLSASWNQNV
jgi:hypothetical protein